ncbi:MAG: substrate-binding domain-containing protein [Halopseudomonas aestusnigri]
MRMLFRSLCVTVLVLFLSGCDEVENTEVVDVPKTVSETDNTSTSASDIKIALVMKTLTNPFFIAMEKGARRAEKELNITLIVKTAAQETSTSQQINIIEKLVREGQVKAIIISPADSVRLIPSLKMAQDKGIHIINIDNKLDSDFAKKAELNDVPYVSIDNLQSAYLSARHVATKITTPAQAALLEGIREADNANLRKDGALRAFAENPNITVVASETAHWKVDEGYEVTKKLFENHPGISVLFCANDMMALGAIEYLRETNRKSVSIASFDGIDEARAAIKEGWLDVTIDQQPGEQGYLGVMLAYRAAMGEKLPSLTMLDGLVITE